MVVTCMSCRSLMNESRLTWLSSAEAPFVDEQVGTNNRQKRGVCWYGDLYPWVTSAVARIQDGREASMRTMTSAMSDVADDDGSWCHCADRVRESSARARDRPGARRRQARRRATETQWRGVHMMSPGREDLPLLKRAIAEKLAPMGVNALILEVNYGFAFHSHPELSGGETALRVEDARDLAETCRKHNIRLVPMFNCLGHQSWSRNTHHSWQSIPNSTRRPRFPRTTRGSTAGAGARSTPMSTRSFSP